MNGSLGFCIFVTKPDYLLDIGLFFGAFGFCAIFMVERPFLYTADWLLTVRSGVDIGWISLGLVLIMGFT